MLYHRDSPSIKKKNTQTGTHNEADTCFFSLSRRDTSGPPRSSLETATESTLTISRIEQIRKRIPTFSKNRHFRGLAKEKDKKYVRSSKCAHLQAYMLGVGMLYSQYTRSRPCTLSARSNNERQGEFWPLTLKGDKKEVDSRL